MSHPGTFSFQGTIFPYLRAHYNNAEANERAIEVPIALNLYNIAQNLPKEPNDPPWILEVGAVLPHYHPNWTQDWNKASKLKSELYPHLCIDKNEDFDGVVKKDIFKMKAPHGKAHQYDLIFSISTMEHVLDDLRLSSTGYQEKWLRKIHEMVLWLNPGGTMLLTIPWGQPSEVGGGAWLDTLIYHMVNYNDPKIPEFPEAVSIYPDAIYKMNRVGFGVAGNKWLEVDPKDSPCLPYDRSVPSASSVFFLLWHARRVGSRGRMSQ